MSKPSVFLTKIPLNLYSQRRNLLFRFFLFFFFLLTLECLHWISINVVEQKKLWKYFFFWRAPVVVVIIFLRWSYFTETEFDLDLLDTFVRLMLQNWRCCCGICTELTNKKKIQNKTGQIALLLRHMHAQKTAERFSRWMCFLVAIRCDAQNQISLSELVLLLKHIVCPMAISLLLDLN